MQTFNKGRSDKYLTAIVANTSLIIRPSIWASGARTPFPHSRVGTHRTSSAVLQVW